MFKKTPILVTTALAVLSVACTQKVKPISTKNENKMTQIKVAIDHYAINVEDLNRSVDFYQKVFGLKEIKNGTELPHIRWFRLGSTQELHIIEVDSLDKKLPKGVHLALAVSDFDSFRKSLTTLNLPYSDWPGANNTISTRPDKVRQLYFEDPDGYWVEVNDGKQFQEFTQN